jgi:uncharacterized protein (DUF1697 family)
VQPVVTYVALLRGVNVGGKNPVAMPALADCLAAEGLRGVLTYLQTGNAVFRARRQPEGDLALHIERALAARLDVRTRIVVRSLPQMKRVLATAPAEWRRDSTLRRNIAFLTHGVTAAEALEQVELKEGVDAAAAGDGVLYLATVMQAVTKSRLRNLISKPIYGDLTIRSFTTCERLLAMMQESSESRDPSGWL